MEQIEKLLIYLDKKNMKSDWIILRVIVSIIMRVFIQIKLHNNS